MLPHRLQFQVQQLEDTGQPPDRGGELCKVFSTHEISFDLYSCLREHPRLMVIERLPIVLKHACDTDYF